MDEDWNPLGCHAVSNAWLWKWEVLQSLETSITIYKSTQYNIPTGFKLQKIDFITKKPTVKAPLKLAKQLSSNFKIQSAT